MVKKLKYLITLSLILINGNIYSMEKSNKQINDSDSDEGQYCNIEDFDVEKFLKENFQDSNNQNNIDIMNYNEYFCILPSTSNNNSNINKSIKHLPQDNNPHDKQYDMNNNQDSNKNN
jgi:hypothetical protein